jgi:hypothetical protein
MPVAEAKTQMAGMQAPAHSPPPAAVGAPPPAAAPAPLRAASPVSEAKTQMAGMQAPIVPQRSAGSATANQKTVALDTSGQPAGGLQLRGGTQILPDSAGVVAFAREKAAEAREAAGPETIPAAPAGALFWLAWIVLGIGVGLGLHVWLYHKP